MSPNAGTVPARLDAAAAGRTDAVAVRFLERRDGATAVTEWSYGELTGRARGTAGALQAAGVAAGERALLLVPSDLDMVRAFFGCLYAGVIAVPLAVPGPRRARQALDRLERVIADADPSVVVTTPEIAELVRDHPAMAGRATVTTDVSAPGTAVGATPGDVAFLQYTSGSTGDPKGVRNTHAALLHQVEFLSGMWSWDEPLRMVSWLPLYHDMGLIMCLLTPLLTGGTCTLMRPATFAADPRIWLEAAVEYGANWIAGPDFAYERCCDVFPPDDAARLDLSRVRYAIDGAEPIRAGTLDRFRAHFAPAGLAPDTLTAGYGLAEACLAVSLSRRPRGYRAGRYDAAALTAGTARRVDDASGRTVVGCGDHMHRWRVAVVDPGERRELPQGAVGEIWVAGEGLPDGYWNRPDETAATFGARLSDGSGPFLRTGDLGFLDGGELYVCGRRRDLIVFQGGNHLPNDIEATLERRIAEVGIGGACAVQDDGGPIRVLAEVDGRLPDGRPAGLAAEIRAAVLDAHDLPVDEVVLVRRGTLRRTSSGKIRRRATAEALTSGRAKVVHHDRRAGSPLDEDGLRTLVAGLLRTDPETLGPDDDLLGHGLTSVMITELSARLSTRGAPVGFGELIRHPTLTAWSELATERAASRSTGPDAEPGGRGGAGAHAGARPDAEVRGGSGTGAETPARAEAGATAGDGGEAGSGTVPGAHAVARPHAEVRREAETGAEAAARAEAGAKAEAGGGAGAGARGGSGGRPGEGEGGAFSLTPVQHAYWIGRREDQGLGGVGCHAYLEFDGRGVDEDRLEAAMRAMLDRHGMLRARFRDDGRQEILPRSPWPGLTVHDLRGSPADEVERRADAIRDELSHRVLDVARGEVIDLRFTRFPGGRCRLHLNVDLLVADAASIRIVLADLAAAYEEPHRALPPIRYDFPAYLRTHATARRAERERDRAYWQERLDDLPDGPSLPLAADPRQVVRPRFHRRTYHPDPDTWDRLTRRARAHGITVSMALAAAFSEVLALWSTEPRFCLNVTLFDRQPLHEAVPDLVADFTGMLLVDVDAGPGGTFLDRARRVQERFQAAVGAGAYSGVEVLRDLTRARGGEPAQAPVVFTSNLGRDLVPERFRRCLGDPGATIAQTPQVWLDHQVHEIGGRPVLSWDSVDDLFPPGVPDAMFGAYERMIAWLAAGEWERPVPGLLPSDQANARAAANATDGPEPAGRLHDGFFTRAADDPGRPALLWGDDERLTYGELADRALRLTAWLHDQGAGPGDRVIVSLPKGPEQVVAVLGVLAAGAAYVPVGVEQPERRRERIRACADVRLVLDALPDLTGRAPLDGPVATGAETSSYVIFTSGSTGEPKGVEVTHAAAVNTIADVNERFAVGPGDRVLAVSALDFDLSVYDLFGLLSAGGAVVLIAEDERRDAQRWLALAGRHGVSVWNTVPVLFDMLLTTAEAAGGMPESLRLVLVSGDWVGLDLRPRLSRLSSSCALIALGGATEAAIWSNLYDVAAVPDGWASIPYGHPLRNQAYRVVDDRERDRPDWVPGELWIGGAGVALGYRNDPGRTAERFVERGGRRWYRTGDLGRYRPGGVLEFLGRADRQVKVRGHRIELGEIEAAAEACPQVRQAIAAVVGAPERLALLVTPETVSGRDLLRELAERLPAYMIPAVVRAVAAAPLSANGKVDRRAAADLLGRDADRDRAKPRPPSGPVERAVAGVWADLLGAEQIARDDDFFRLGGDSLLATRLMSRLEDAGVRGATLGALFATPVLAEFAAGLALGGTASPASPLRSDPGRRYEPFPLTDVQRAYWIGRSGRLRLGGVGTHYYTELDGRNVDLARFEEAWNRIVARHEMLRAVLTPDGEQRVLPEVPRYEIPVREVSAEAALAELRESMSHQVIDPERWPLFDLRAVRYGDRVRVGVSLDYIVLDGASIMLLLAELAGLYAGDALPEPPGMSFRDYVLTVAPTAEERAAAEAYWRERLPELPPAPPLPLAVDPASVARPRFTRRERRVPAGRWAEIKRRARDHGLTPSAALLTCYVEDLAAWGGQPELTVHLTLFDRREVHPDVGRVLGDFTTLLPLAHRSVPGASWLETARRVRDRLARDLDHREVSSLWVLRELARERGEDTAGLPVVFTSTLGLTDDLFTNLPAEFPAPVFALTQTPQVWLDHQVREESGDLILSWDAVDALFPPGDLDAMFTTYTAAVDRLAEAAWDEPAEPIAPLAATDAEAILRAHPRIADAVLEGGAAAIVPVVDAVPIAEATADEDAGADAGLDAGAGAGPGAGPNPGVGAGAGSGASAGGNPGAGLGAGADTDAGPRAGADASTGAGAEAGGPSADPPEANRAGAGAGAGPGAGAGLGAGASGQEERRVEALLLWMLVERLGLTLDGSGAPEVAAGQEAVVRVWLDWLVARGVLVAAGDGYRPGPEYARAYGGTPEPEVAGALVPVLRGERDPLTLLDHPTLSPEAVIAGRPEVAGAVETIAAELDRMAAELDRPLRVAELGARSGRVTERVLARLLTPVAYTLLDPSPALLDAARERLDPARGRLDPGRERLDPSGERPDPARERLDGAGERLDPARKQLNRAGERLGGVPHLLDFQRLTGEHIPGGLLHRFDVVVAAASLHRFAEPQRGPAVASLLLAPGGRLLAVEPGELPAAALVSIVPAERGFAGLDPERRARRSPLLDAQGWRELLGNAGLCPARERRNGAILLLTARRPADAPVLDLTDLRAWLAERSPSGTRPDRYMVLPDLPRTTDGSPDRAAVRRIAHRRDATPTTYEPPRGPVEELVAKVWADVLGVERVARTDDFFLMGGDSLLATRLAARLRTAGLDGVELARLFADPVLADFAATLTPGGATGTAPTLVPDPARRHEPFALTDVQQAYWIGRSDDLPLGGVGSYCYFEFDGADVDAARLEEACNRLIARHDMLRAVLNDDGTQRVLTDVPRFTVPVTEEADGQAALAALREEMAHQVIDLGTWPLFDVRAVRYGDCTRIGVGLDNFVLDGLSMMTFLAELARLYDDPDAVLPPVDVTFRDYVAGLGGDPAARERAEAYWRDRVAALPPAPVLPLAADPSAIVRPRFTRLADRLPAAVWERIRRRAREHGLTPSAVLLTCYAQVLSAWSARPDLTVNLTLFDRRDAHPHIDRVLGDFTSLLLLPYAPEDTVLASARGLQDGLAGALEHREVSAVWVLRELARERARRGEPAEAAAMPVVFTSALGLDADVPDGFPGQVWGLSQTPQVWLDHQVYESGGELLFNWDAVRELFAPGVLEDMFAAYRRLLDRLAGTDWDRPFPDLTPRGYARPTAPQAVPAGPAGEPERTGGEEPRGPAEKALADLWAELLGVAGVGRRDNFFALGGDSLLATRVAAAVRTRFGCELPLRRLFATPTIAGLAPLIDDDTDDAYLEGTI